MQKVKNMSWEITAAVESMLYVISTYANDEKAVKELLHFI